MTQRAWLRFSPLHLTLLDQVLVSGVNFVTTLILARSLGAAMFGCFSLGWMALLFAQTVQSGLIIFPMMSLGPQTSAEDAPGYYAGTAFMQTLFSIITILALGLFCDAQYQLKPWAWLFGAIGGMVLWQDFVRRFFFTSQSPGKALLIDVISYGGQLAGLGILAWLGALCLNTALMMIGMTSMISALVGFFLFPQMPKDLPSYRNAIQRNIRSGFWLTGASLSQWAGAQGMLLLSGWLLSPTALGGIRAVINIAAPVNSLMQGLQNIIPVRAAAARQAGGYLGMMRELGRTAVVLCAGALAIILLASLFAKPLMTLAYGNEYKSFAPWITWQGVYVLLGCLVFVTSIYFRTLEETPHLWGAYVISAVAALAAGWATIPTWGVGGVFVSLITNQLLLVLCSVWFARRLHQRHLAEEAKMP